MTQLHIIHVLLFMVEQTREKKQACFFPPLTNTNANMSTTSRLQSISICYHKHIQVTAKMSEQQIILRYGLELVDAPNDVISDFGEFAVC